jgi:hypothetical protein
MKTAILALALVTAMFVGACGEESNFEKNFVGSYRNTLTLSGAGSQTFTDSLSVSPGQTSDLIFNSQQLGAVKVTILSENSFSLDQQQIMLTDGNGQSFSVTLQGQGTVTSGVFNASGTLSSSSGAFSFTWAGQRL